MFNYFQTFLNSKNNKLFQYQDESTHYWVLLPKSKKLSLEKLNNYQINFLISPALKERSFRYV